MKLRKARATDLDDLVRIELSGDVHWGINGLTSALNDPNILLLVAEDDADILTGFIVVLIVANEMQVQNVVVDLQYRRKGIAFKLLETAEDMARRRGATEMFLEVASHNCSAISLYKKAGFMQIGMRPDFYSNGDDAILLKKVM